MPTSVLPSIPSAVNPLMVGAVARTAARVSALSPPLCTMVLTTSWKKIPAAQAVAPNASALSRPVYLRKVAVILLALASSNGTKIV